MPVVILEGVNRTGKSTMCKWLSDTGFSVLNDDSIANVADSIKGAHAYGGLWATTSVIKALSDKRINLAIDRFHLTEFVYGQVMRGYVPMYVFDIDMVLKEAGAKLILMTDTLDNVMERNPSKDMALLYKLMGSAYDMSVMDKMAFNLQTGEKSAVIDFIWK